MEILERQSRAILFAAILVLASFVFASFQKIQHVAGSAKVGKYFSGQFLSSSLVCKDEISTNKVVNSRPALFIGCGIFE